MSTWQGDIYSASYVAPVVATVVLTVTAPDGSTSTPTVVTTGAPTYTSTVLGSQVGTYLLTWVASGTVVDVFVDQFTVVAPSIALISFTELKDQLNIDVSDTSGSAKLRRFMQSASDVVQNITGPLLGQTRTEYFDGNRSSIVLTPRWVLSITTITENVGPSVFTLTEQPLASGGSGQYGYTWDRLTHEITRRTSGVTGWFPAGDGNVAVTYKMGINPLPQVISDATGELIRHWWANGQTAFTSPFGAASDDVEATQIILGYAVPRVVTQMLAPFAIGPGLV